MKHQPGENSWVTPGVGYQVLVWKTPQGWKINALDGIFECIFEHSLWVGEENTGLWSCQVVVSRGCGIVGDRVSRCITMIGWYVWNSFSHVCDTNSQRRGRREILGGWTAHSSHRVKGNNRYESIYWGNLGGHYELVKEIISIAPWILGRLSGGLKEYITKCKCINRVQRKGGYKPT